MAADLIGGRYRLETLLGKGGMSEVWRAEDLELGRRVALKLLAPDADRERFAREARAVAALAHPNITQLWDYGEVDGRPFMVLEYLPGGTLEERLQPGIPLSDQDATRVATEIAAGLAHAHARGLVHRDLKPANVLFDAEGRAKIADFGIARLGHGGTLTEAGTVLGTAAYISPEQAAGEPATPASDVYSFGVLLYRLLSGRLPFVSDDAFALVSLHRDATPPPLADVRPDAPPALAAVVAAALAKDPAHRPSNGAAIAAALAQPDDGTFPIAAPTATARDPDATAVLAPATAMPTATETEAASGRRRTLPLVVAGVLALLAAGGAALGYTVSRSHAPSAAPSPTVLPAVKTKPSKDRHVTTAAATAAVAASPATSATTSTATTTTTATTTRTRTRTATAPAATVSPPTTTVPTVTTTPPTTTDTTVPATTGTTTGP